MRSRYIPIKKANVYISNGFKKLFYGMRTLYSKGFRKGFYVRYKNRYYRAHFDGRYTYTVRL
jgi:hypothetical protein